MDPTQTRARFIRNEQVLSLQISIVPWKSLNCLVVK
jgi:hypothetical protein